MPTPPPGVLVIDKPAGPTSHDVVAAARRALGLRRIGHTGTLDPAASGVLPLVLGQATRLARFFSETRKTYVARVRLGTVTDSYDAEGQVQPGTPARRPADLTLPEIEEALARFRGTFLQAPPPFSAKKIDGVRAYTLARRQQAVQPAPVQVTVYALDLVERTAEELVLRVTCSAGFYVRTLAHDLGARLGTGAHLAALRRVDSGGFGEADAVPLAALVDGTAAAADRIVPLDRLLPWMPAVTLTGGAGEKVRQGRDLEPGDVAAWPAAPLPAWIRVLETGGHLLALAEPRGAPAVLHPSVVLK